LIQNICKEKASGSGLELVKFDLVYPFTALVSKSDAQATKSDKLASKEKISKENEKVVKAREKATPEKVKDEVPKIDPSKLYLKVGVIVSVSTFLI
jgi:hypothetical protein